MRGDLLSAVSHDLRTPLASIEGSAGALLRQAELSDQSKQLASTIQEESVRMARLIRNLLDMTRVQGTIDLDLDWYGLDELVANAIMRTESMFEHPVKLEVHPDTPLVRMDGALMEQVFVNLLENAARYAGREAYIVVEILRGSDGVEALVSDDGPGLAPGTESLIFERFQGSKTDGFGLGLAICRAAVEAHGGQISAFNRVRGGAQFRIVLPAQDEESVG
jgi:two-component system sensor histidine kinase KdpD